MKPSYIIIIAFVAFSMFLPAVSHADEAIDAVNGYLDALTKGDTASLKSYINGKYYKSRKSLLDENPDYSRFLLDFYEGANFSIIDISADSKNIDCQRATVEFVFPGGNISRTQLILAMDSYGIWKIIDEEN
jgi:hypothetical protein